MKSPVITVLAVTAALLAAGAQAAPIDRKETIRLDRAAIVGSSVLPSGSYRIELASNPDIVRFVKGKRTVAEVPYKLGFATEFYRANAVHYRPAGNGQNRLIKIVLADSKLAIEIKSPVDLAGDGGGTATAN